MNFLYNLIQNYFWSKIAKNLAINESCLPTINIISFDNKRMLLIKKIENKTESTNDSVPINDENKKLLNKKLNINDIRKMNLNLGYKPKTSGDDFLAKNNNSKKSLFKLQKIKIPKLKISKFKILKKQNHDNELIKTGSIDINDIYHLNMKKKFSADLKKTSEINIVSVTSPEIKTAEFGIKIRKKQSSQKKDHVDIFKIHDNQLKQKIAKNKKEVQISIKEHKIKNNLKLPEIQKIDHDCPKCNSKLTYANNEKTNKKYIKCTNNECDFYEPESQWNSQALQNYKDPKPTW